MNESWRLNNLFISDLNWLNIPEQVQYKNVLYKLFDIDVDITAWNK